MATADILRDPVAMAEKIATRSAHIVKPYDAFSTLTPVKTFPRSSRTAAATGNREYGAYAKSRWARACLIKFSASIEAFSLGDKGFIRL
jgi:hypothetical protein